MTLDEAIAHEKEVAKKVYVEAMLCHANPDDGELDDCIECGKYHEQLAEWLEELKELQNITAGHLYAVAFKNGYLKAEKEVRNKAIDDFTGEIKDWQIDIQDNEYDAEKFDFVFERIYEIAEQLKAGGDNEQG